MSVLAQGAADVRIDDAVGACFHCGLPLPAHAPWQVEIDGVAQAMCCPGCAAVAHSIVENGLADYYRTRSAFSVTAGPAALVPPELQLYDNDERVVDGAGETCELSFSVEGIRCAACVWLIERQLARLPGVHSATMNVAAERVQVRWQRALCKPSVLLMALRAIGYVAYPYDPVKHGEQLERSRKTMFRQLFIAGLSMMQVMMYALPVYLATDGTMDGDMHALMRWAGLLLTLPAIVYSARPFFLGAWVNLKSGMLGMDVPVALGIGAAFGASIVATVRGQGEVYFDSVTMFIFLLLGSRYLEFVARRKAASALDNLQHALPASALRMLDYPARQDTALVALDQLREGDFILVKPGEAVGADGVIVEGDTALDLSLLTGESAAQRKLVGDSVPGGAVNAGQPLVLRVSRAARDSTLSMLVKLVERAGQGKPQLALWADRVAAWFVTLLLLFALAVFGYWEWADAARAWPIAIAVLVVSCPCALSLATPTALAAATDRLVRQGVLIVQRRGLETLPRARHVVFDKTGTLTVGKPVLKDLVSLGGQSSDWCLQVAAALEASSAHPLAGAIVAAAQQAALRGVPGQRASAVRHVVGQGVEGVVDGTIYRLGSAAYVSANQAGDLARLAPPNVSAIYLGVGGRALARFDLADALRGDARDVVRAFQGAGKRVILLSGDEQAVTRQVADQLGIDTALGQYLPEQKLAYVQSLQAVGAVVAMVGDGVNDAAVLRGADVSFAMGGGTALAQMHADCVLLSGRLASLSDVALAARQTISVVRQNLAWATLYNLIAIPAAALGLLNPWMSGIGMSLSSAVVVLNALRLRRIKRAQSAAATARAALPQHIA